MQRRKFIAGLGSLAAAGAAGIGTGAFTSVSAQRNVSVQLAEDSNAFLKLEPGTSGLVTDNGDGLLDINIDGTNAAGTGANMNAVTEIGDPADPANEHAFAVKNQGTQALMFKMNYYLSNPGWVENNGNNDQSHLQFTVHDAGGADGRNGSHSMKYPAPNGNRDDSLGQPTGSGFGSNTGTYKFDVGETYYVTMTIDTTGANAEKSDDLSGTAVIAPDTTTSQDHWDPENPPSL